MYKIHQNHIEQQSVTKRLSIFYWSYATYKILLLRKKKNAITSRLKYFNKEMDINLAYYILLGYLTNNVHIFCSL